MKKKVLIGIIALIVLTIVVIGCYWWYNSENIRKAVLNQLRENLEFCSIIRDSVNVFSDTGEFWLICNGRPFYATYKNGNVSYELNGWGFLKEDSNVWNDLKDCDFYDYRDSEMIFYCPKDFNSNKLTAKIYRFDSNSLKMNKVGEKDFLEIIGNDIKSVYSFLSPCEIKSFKSIQFEQYPAGLLITFNCGNESYVVETDLAIVPLQPPILLDSLSYEERAKISFKKSFNLSIESISTDKKKVSISSSFGNNEFSVSYDFREMPFITYKITCSESMEECLRKIIKYFILPPTEKIVSVETIKNAQQKSFYKINDAIIGVISIDKSIIHVWRNTEGIYR